MSFLRHRGRLTQYRFEGEQETAGLKRMVPLSNRVFGRLPHTLARHGIFPNLLKSPCQRAGIALRHHHAVFLVLSNPPETAPTVSVATTGTLWLKASLTT